MDRILPDPQNEIIERYCGEARALLDNAASEEEALAIRTRLCARLAEECASRLVQGATETYVDEFIRRKWSVPLKGERHGA